MKISADVLKYVLNDGGFKVFAAKCGHKGDICQWQDIHNVLTELFFAYSRDKYEVLSISALAGSYTYPKQVLENFKNGEWTVSYKGRPYHSLALGMHYK